MTVSDLSPGDCVTFRGEPYYLGQHLGDGMNTILQWAHDPCYTACVPSSLEVVDGTIIDRPAGEAEPNTADLLRDTVSGDPLSRRKSETPYFSARSGAMLALFDPDRFHALFGSDRLPRDPEAGAPVEKDRPAMRSGERPCRAAPGETHNSRRGTSGPVHSPARPTAHGSTPGILDDRAAPLLRWFLIGLATWALLGAAAMLPPGRWFEVGMYTLIAVIIIAAVWRD